MLRFKVNTAEEGKRIDTFITDRLANFSRASLSRLFSKNLVLIDGQSAKPGKKLKSGNTVKIDDRLLRQEPKPVKLVVLYEDDDVIVVDKPPGILTHSKGVLNHEPSVAGFIKSRLTDKNLTGNRAGIVHRLDRGTSGVVIAAKNTRSLNWLQKQFSTRKVLKTYTAIVLGKPEPGSAIIDAPIERNPKKPQTFRVGAAGKPAITEYKTIEALSNKAGSFSLLELKPLTGRTHQLRVHLSYVGHPVVGDPIYGQKTASRLMLHASSLELKLPSGETKKFKSPLPDGIKLSKMGDEQTV